jgi:hypothetical protein
MLKSGWNPIIKRGDELQFFHPTRDCAVKPSSGSRPNEHSQTGAPSNFTGTTGSSGRHYDRAGPRKLWQRWRRR